MPDRYYLQLPPVAEIKSAVQTVALPSPYLAFLAVDAAKFLGDLHCFLTGS